MPRHPPCALHSLSHTPPTQPTHPATKNDPTPTPHNRKPQRSRKKSHNEDEPDMAVHTTHYKRCSRPLSRSQTTTPHPPRTAHHTRPASAGSLEPKPQTAPLPSLPGKGWRSDSSEPQQCAPTHQTGPGTGISRPQTRPDLHPAHPKANRTQRVRECR